MPISKEAKSTITSQTARLGAEPPTMKWPRKRLEELVEAFEGAQFQVLEKNEDTIWGAYRAPQVLIVLDRTLEVAKGHEILQRVTYFEKDGGKISANCDLKGLLKEVGLIA